MRGGREMNSWASYTSNRSCRVDRNGRYRTQHYRSFWTIQSLLWCNPSPKGWHPKASLVGKPPKHPNNSNPKSITGLHRLMEALRQTHPIAQLTLERRLPLLNEFTQLSLKQSDVPFVRQIIANFSDVIGLNEQISAQPTKGKRHLKPLRQPCQWAKSRHKRAAPSGNAIGNLAPEHLFQALIRVSSGNHRDNAGLLGGHQCDNLLEERNLGFKRRSLLDELIHPMLAERSRVVAIDLQPPLLAIAELHGGNIRIKGVVHEAPRNVLSKACSTNWLVFDVPDI